MDLFEGIMFGYFILIGLLLVLFVFAVFLFELLSFYDGLLAGTV